MYDKVIFMSKELFEQASRNLYDKMVADGVKGIMQYKPFFDDYWTEKPKIVMCNYENFGYQNHEKPSLLTYEDFEWWFNEKITKGKSRTVHYTVVFANALQKIINEFPSVSLTVGDMRKSYRKTGELYQSMKNIMYMNLRPTSAKGNRQEIEETHKIIHKYKNEMKVYLETLDADIFVLSTKHSVDLFNFIFDIKNSMPLKFNKNTNVNGTMVFSVNHFRFPRYNYWYKKILEIAYIWYHR